MKMDPLAAQWNAIHPSPACAQPGHRVPACGIVPVVFRRYAPVIFWGGTEGIVYFVLQKQFHDLASRPVNNEEGR
jgi:hypothetical protein